MDLNLQFPAGWEQAKQIKFSQGFTSPAPRDFVGFGPLTEPEALAIYNFTLQHNFSLVIAFHTQGNVIFWQFQNYNPPRALFIGNEFARVSGYSLEKTPFNSSFAGYKDWFIQDYNRPGYTVEVGEGQNPLPTSPHVQVALQPHESKKLNLVVPEKSCDFSYTIKRGYILYPLNSLTIISFFFHYFYYSNYSYYSPSYL